MVILGLFLNFILNSLSHKSHDRILEMAALELF